MDQRKDRAEILSIHAMAIIQATAECGEPVAEVCVYRNLIQHGYDDGEIDCVIRGLFELGFLKRVGDSKVTTTPYGDQAAAEFREDTLTH